MAAKDYIDPEGYWRTRTVTFSAWAPLKKVASKQSSLV